MALVDLPLFPLDVVLLPAMSLPLHIFEPRYREMIAFCMGAESRFGVLLLKARPDAIGESYDVGTVAEIMDTSRLEDNKLNIVAEGRQRFRIIERQFDRSYLHGTVAMLSEPVGEVQDAARLAIRCRRLMDRYIQLLMKQVDQPSIDLELPQGPVELSYRVANVLEQLQPSAIQSLQEVLEAETAVERLQLEVAILRREYAILQFMADSAVSHFPPHEYPN
jgi:Lon protease-like protein